MRSSIKGFLIRQRLKPVFDEYRDFLAAQSSVISAQGEEEDPEDSAETKLLRRLATSGASVSSARQLADASRILGRGSGPSSPLKKDSGLEGAAPSRINPTSSNGTRTAAEESLLPQGLARGIEPQRDSLKKRVSIEGEMAQQQGDDIAHHGSRHRTSEAGPHHHHGEDHQLKFFPSMKSKQVIGMLRFESIKASHMRAPDAAATANLSRKSLSPPLEGIIEQHGDNEESEGPEVPSGHHVVRAEVQSTTTAQSKPAETILTSRGIKAVVSVPEDEDEQPPDNAASEWEAELGAVLKQTASARPPLEDSQPSVPLVKQAAALPSSADAAAASNEIGDETESTPSSPRKDGLTSTLEKLVKEGSASMSHQ